MKIKTFIKKVLGRMLILLIIFIIGALVIAGVFQTFSPGKPEPYIDQAGNIIAGSLSEKVFVNIGGVKQGMIIKSKDTTNPVLLYLHGGLPEYFLNQKYPSALEDCFTVVWWEQRGSGISYSTDISPGTITLEQLNDKKT